MVKNGHIHNGKQRYRCKSCGRQFVYGATTKRISEETKQRVDKLLLEKLSLAGIARVLDVSETWLQGYVNKKYAIVEHRVVDRRKFDRSQHFEFALHLLVVVPLLDFLVHPVSICFDTAYFSFQVT